MSTPHALSTAVFWVKVFGQLKSYNIIKKRKVLLVAHHVQETVTCHLHYLFTDDLILKKEKNISSVI